MFKRPSFFLCLGIICSVQGIDYQAVKACHAIKVAGLGCATAGVHISCAAVFQGREVSLETPLVYHGDDSLALHTLRFYCSNLVFLNQGKVVFQDPANCHLLDFESEKSLSLPFDLAPNQQFDQIRFQLGIDSLTNIAGAMGGDLDPTKGMFWTWQSGYINAKLEGYYSKCPARNHAFQFHLGGYLAPFQTVQTVVLAAPHAQQLQLQLDLSPFFEQLDWAGKSSIMSPGKEAVTLSATLSKSFSLHAR